MHKLNRNFVDSFVHKVEGIFELDRVPKREKRLAPKKRTTWNGHIHDENALVSLEVHDFKSELAMAAWG